MAVFRKFSKQKIFTAVDMGSAVKVVVFEVGGGKLTPSVRLKKVIPLPKSGSLERAGPLLREIIFDILRELEQVPDRIAVSLGSEVGQTSVTEWRAKPADGTGIRSRKELSSYFKNLTDQHRDPSRALVAHPVGILVNGYAVDLCRDSEKIFARPLRGDITFVTLLLSIAFEAGTALAAAKLSLGGLPIEFVPRLAAEAETLCGALAAREGLLIEIGTQETDILRLAEGIPLHTASFPFELENGKPGEWKQNFLKALDEFYYLGPLSPDVFLVGEGAARPELRSTLEDSDWLKGYSYLESADVRAVPGTRLLEGHSLDGAIGGPEDFALASLIYYVMHHEALF